MERVSLYLTLAIILSAIAAALGTWLSLRQGKKGGKQPESPKANSIVNQLPDSASPSTIHEDAEEKQLVIIADKIATILKKDNRWAVEALEIANLRPRIQSLFSERMGHFREEKEYIAKNFVPLLMDRCRRLIESQNKKVYLLIDSGTTLYPFFAKLGEKGIQIRRAYEETVDNQNDKEFWLNKLIIVTNNLPGFSSLIETARFSRDKYSDLAIKCEILPGAPLPIYSAVTGEKTQEALYNLGKGTEENSIFIGLVTGSWIRLSSRPVPIPLARGRGHKAFKQAMINKCNEIYVVAPLGKVFLDVELEELNTAMDFRVDLGPDSHPYEEVFIDPSKAECVKLVSTSRLPGRILTPLGNRLKDFLHVRQLLEGIKFTNTPINRVPHVLFPFDIPKFDDFLFQIQTEFPHKHTRNFDFMENYFFVDTSPFQVAQ